MPMPMCVCVCVLWGTSATLEKWYGVSDLTHIACSSWPHNACTPDINNEVEWMIHENWWVTVGEVDRE